MAQHDYNIANQTFPNTRTDINNALSAVASNNSGTAAPSTTFANQWFYETDTNLLQIRNEDNDAYITIAELDQSNDTVEYFKADSIRTALIEFTDGDDAITIADGGLTTFSAKITADAGIDIDNFNIDGTTIALSSGDITIDSAGRIDLSADDNGEIRLFDGSSQYAQFKDDSDRLKIQGMIADKDMHFVVNNGGSEATSIVIDSTGAVTKPLQPAFLGSVVSTQSNLSSGDHILFPTIRSINRGADYSSSIFTADISGLYQFNVHVSVTGLDRTATFVRLQLVTTNQTYSFDIRPAQLYDSAPTHHAFDGSILADLDVGDTAFVRWSQSGGSVTADVFDSSFFSGFLVC